MPDSSLFHFSKPVYYDIAHFLIDYKDYKWMVYEKDFENYHILYDVDLREVYVTDNDNNDEEVNHDFDDFLLDGEVEKIINSREDIKKTEKILCQQLSLF